MQKVVLAKKGIAKAHLAMFVLAIAAAVILLAFTGKISFVAEDLSVTEQCRASVVRNARYHIAGINLGSEIDCPMRKIVLEKENEEEAKRKVANAMYACWKQFERGRLNLFDGEGVFCNVCYIIDVKTKEPIKGFGTYLLETPSPSENLYYSDYLSGFTTPKAQEVVKKAELDGVKIVQNELSNKAGENKYGVLFLYAKGQDSYEKIVRQLKAESTAGKVITPIAGGTAVAAGLGVGVGAALFVVGAPVTVPVTVVVASGAGAAALAGGITFVGVEAVGLMFNPDAPPEWVAINALIPWNPDKTPEILRDELGCIEFVETQTS